MSIRVNDKQSLIIPIIMQDIPPYTAYIYHINSMMQPWPYISAPIVGSTMKMNRRRSSRSVVRLRIF